MKVGWLIDAEAFPAYADELAAEVSRCGGESVFAARPDAPYSWDDVNSSYRRAFPRETCVVTHGDIDLVTRVQLDGRWKPGAFAATHRFFCSHYYSRVGGLTTSPAASDSQLQPVLLNHDYFMVPFGELPRRLDALLEALGVEQQLFVRPDSPLKLFTGMTIHRETFPQDYELMGFYDVPLESLVVVSSPKTIEQEWRFVVVDGKVVAGSLYRDGEADVTLPARDEGARALAEQVAAMDWQPDPVWVLDICRTMEGKYRVLELGGFSFSDLYGCDLSLVVRAVSRAAQSICEQT